MQAHIPTIDKPRQLPGPGGRGGWLRWAGGLPWVAPTARREVEPVSGLLLQSSFLDAAVEVAARCDRRQVPLSLAVFDFTDLVEVHRLYGRDVSHELLTRLAASLQTLAGRGGLAARTSPTQFAVLLSGVNRRGALAQVRQVLGQVPCLELDTGDDELVLVADFLWDEVKGEAPAVVLQRLCAGLERIQDHRMRMQRYLRMERESHTRPAELR